MKLNPTRKLVKFCIKRLSTSSSAKCYSITNIIQKLHSLPKPFANENLHGKTVGGMNALATSHCEGLMVGGSFCSNTLHQLIGYELFILCKKLYYYNKESSLECSSLDIFDDEYPVLAGPNNNSRQKSGPHIELPFFPTLSNSCTVSYKIQKGTLSTHWIPYLIVHDMPYEVHFIFTVAFLK